MNTRDVLGNVKFSLIFVRQLHTSEREPNFNSVRECRLTSTWFKAEKLCGTAEENPRLMRDTGFLFQPVTWPWKESCWFKYLIFAFKMT